jgi:hypothetical protein
MPCGEKGCKARLEQRALSSALSPVLFESNEREIPPVSPNFHINTGGILCTSDSMAVHGSLLLTSLRHLFAPAK